MVIIGTLWPRCDAATPKVAENNACHMNHHRGTSSMIVLWYGVETLWHSHAQDVAVVVAFHQVVERLVAQLREGDPGPPLATSQLSLPKQLAEKARCGAG